MTTPIDRTPESYRETIKQFLRAYYERRKWEIEQGYLGIIIPRAPDELICGSALADQLCDIARMAAGELDADDEHVCGVVYEGIQDLMERLFAPPGLGAAYDIPARFWSTDLGAIVGKAFFRVQGDGLLITITEAAEILGISLSAVSNRIDRGHLTPYRDPDEANPQRARRVRRDQVLALRDAQSDRQRLEAGATNVPCAHCGQPVLPGSPWHPGPSDEVCHDHCPDQ